MFALALNIIFNLNLTKKWVYQPPLETARGENSDK